jgi:hypothetical protein
MLAASQISLGSLLQVNHPVEVTKSHRVKLKIGD